MKSCYFCGKSAPNTFDAESVFCEWADENQIIDPNRSRFYGVLSILKWAALDETDKGCHPKCALRYAIKHEGYDVRYPIIPDV